MISGSTPDKIINSKVLAGTLIWLRKNHGPEVVKEYFERVGLPESCFDDPDAWISWPQYLKMLDEIVALTGDPSSLFRVAREYTANVSGIGEIWFLIFDSLFSARSIFRKAVKFNHYFNRSADWEFMDLGRNKVRFRIKWKDGIRTNRNACLHRGGGVSAIPTMLGLPPAEFREVQCQADGYDCCIDEYAWRNAPARKSAVLFAFITAACALLAVNTRLLAGMGLTESAFLVLSLTAIAFLAGFMVDAGKKIREINKVNAEQNRQIETSLRRLEERYDELKKAAEEKLRMEKELQKNQQLEALGILAGGIAHDFNNIMGVILSHIAIVSLNIGNPQKARTHLDAAERGFLKARRLTQQLLTFSKGGAPIREATDLESVISDSADFALRGTNVRCEYSIPEDLSAVDADEGQISQVIGNLIINACQAMPEGGVIRVRAENTVLDARDHVHIAIEDEGVGIPPEELGRVFDPFYTTKPEGSGLGLAVAHSIIKKHDGLINVESRPGRTVFHLYLPASKEEAPVKPAIRETVVMGAGNILVMDDDKEFREAVSEGLREFGYTAETASDGLDALRKYEEALEAGKRFDAVVLDLTVPGGMGGKETIKRLVELDSGVKAIVSSGYSNNPVMSEYRAHGFGAVLVKPYSIQRLSMALHEVLGYSKRTT